MLNYSLPPTPLRCYRIRIVELAECGAVYPGRITRGGGVISLATVDNRRVVGAFSFVFSVCMFGGDEVEC